jgi:hypothetical protein
LCRNLAFAARGVVLVRGSLAKMLAPRFVAERVTDVGGALKGCTDLFVQHRRSVVRQFDRSSSRASSDRFRHRAPPSWCPPWHALGPHTRLVKSFRARVVAGRGTNRSCCELHQASAAKAVADHGRVRNSAGISADPHRR